MYFKSKICDITNIYGVKKIIFNLLKKLCLTENNSRTKFLTESANF